MLRSISLSILMLLCVLALSVTAKADDNCYQVSSFSLSYDGLVYEDIEFVKTNLGRIADKAHLRLVLHNAHSAERQCYLQIGQPRIGTINLSSAIGIELGGRSVPVEQRSLPLPIQTFAISLPAHQVQQFDIELASETVIVLTPKLMDLAQLMTDSAAQNEYELMIVGAVVATLLLSVLAFAISRDYRFLSMSMVLMSAIIFRTTIKGIGLHTLFAQLNDLALPFIRYSLFLLVVSTLVLGLQSLEVKSWSKTWHRWIWANLLFLGGMFLASLVISHQTTIYLLMLGTLAVIFSLPIMAWQSRKHGIPI